MIDYGRFSRERGDSTGRLEGTEKETNSKEDAGCAKKSEFGEGRAACSAGSCQSRAFHEDMPQAVVGRATQRAVPCARNEST
jgi:hypothetical protein